MFSATPSRLHSASHAKAMISLSGKSSVRRSPLSANVCTFATCAGNDTGWPSLPTLAPFPTLAPAAHRSPLRRQHAAKRTDRRGAERNQPFRDVLPHASKYQTARDGTQQRETERAHDKAIQQRINALLRQWLNGPGVWFVHDSPLPYVECCAASCRAPVLTSPPAAVPPAPTHHADRDRLRCGPWAGWPGALRP